MSRRAASAILILALLLLASCRSEPGVVRLKSKEIVYLDSIENPFVLVRERTERNLLWYTQKEESNEGPWWVDSVLLIDSPELMQEFLEGFLESHPPGYAYREAFSEALRDNYPDSFFEKKCLLAFYGLPHSSSIRYELQPTVRFEAGAVCLMINTDGDISIQNDDIVFEQFLISLSRSEMEGITKAVLYINRGGRIEEYP